MKLWTVTQLRQDQQLQLMQLWNREYPEQLGHKDISTFRSYLDGLTNATHYLLADDQEHVKAWAFTFTRNGDRWFAIILDRVVQGKGYGSFLLDQIKAKEQSLYGWVTDQGRYTRQDATPYPSPVAFYIKNGFRICDGDRLETEQLSAVKIHWSQQA